MKKNKNILIVFTMAILILIGYVYFNRPNTAIEVRPKEIGTPEKSTTTLKQVCPMDVKICPDGLSIGRSGNNCEFVCPNSAWETFKSDKDFVSFKYLSQMPTEYISIVDWPPKFTVSTGLWSCIEKNSPSMDNTTKMVNEYCVAKESQGAAGSVYETYNYTFKIDSFGLIKRKGTFTFTLRKVGCYNYDEPKKSACFKEQGGFDVTKMVDTMVSSLKYK